jgi:hypothetical protein
MDWGDWAQQVSGSLINKYADNQWVQPYELQRMQLQALGQMGYYQEGQASIGINRNGLNISPTLLLLGAVVMVVMMTRD